MKNVAIGFILLLILVFTGVTVYSIEGKTVRKNELDTNLGTAMEQSMTILTIDPTYDIDKENSDHFIADFIENFLIKTTTDSTFQIEILSVDTKKGLLDVKVTETFKQFAGLPGKVSARKTVILEDYVNEDNVFYKVSFYVEEKDKTTGEIKKNIVKQVNVHGGDTLAYIQPTDPVKKGYKFSGWNLDGTDAVYQDISVLHAMKDLSFTATFVKDESK